MGTLPGMKGRHPRGVGALVLTAAVWAWFTHLGRRTGVSAADIARPLPGDDLVVSPQLVADRAVVLPVAAADAWPWLVQLGKDRGGWYMPAWVERLIWNRDKRGARNLLPEWQKLAVGDTVPDWGPGKPVFKVATLEAPRALVHHSLRQRSRAWTWPDPDRPTPPDTFSLSWALVLDDLDRSRSRLHIRLRADPGGRRLRSATATLFGLVDWITVALLFAGLRERLIAGRPD
jgi:hypothetical protein